MRLKSAIAALILVVGFAAPVAAGPYEDAAAAYGRGDYGAAMRLWRPFADQGDPHAQFNLGLMYSRGQGLAPDYAAAVSLFRKAADQGNASGQSGLGFMYRNGLGVR
jgi:uncharacterized protein